MKADIGVILRELCKRKEVEVIEATACPDHIHMLAEIPQKMSVSSFMGYQRKKHADDIRKACTSKKQIRDQALLVQGYYVSTVDRNKTAIAKYIQNQLQEDMMSDQLTQKNMQIPLMDSL